MQNQNQNQGQNQNQNQQFNNFGSTAQNAGWSDAGQGGMKSGDVPDEGLVVYFLYSLVTSSSLYRVVVSRVSGVSTENHSRIPRLDGVSRDSSSSSSSSSSIVDTYLPIYLNLHSYRGRPYKENITDAMYLYFNLNSIPYYNHIRYSEPILLMYDLCIK